MAGCRRHKDQDQQFISSREELKMSDVTLNLSEQTVFDWIRNSREETITCAGGNKCSRFCQVEPCHWVDILRSSRLGQKAYCGSSDYRVRDMLILKPFREWSKHSQETLWQLRLRHLFSVSTSASDYGLPALRLRKRA